MRASDADRERIVDVLQGAAGDGRLTPEELDDRLGAALSARTLDELAPLTADLGAAPGRPGGLTAQAPDVVRIDQRGGSAQRTGSWLVPRRLKLRPKWCRVTLDFTDAVLTHDALDIDMNMRGGALILVTGPGMTVDADKLSARYAAVNIRPTSDSGLPVTLSVHLSGRIRYGRIDTR
jgi:hypothetical protein